ncbi:Uncharacterised protein [uncultured archaeon]|nr:Uncharacterised protein [uncultured archaeon]
MAKKDKSKGKKLALTILIGIFIAIMVITLFNLIVTYVYPVPDYNKFCNMTNAWQSSPVKINENLCCNLSKSLQNEQTNCYSQGGQPIFSYNDNGCADSLKKCDLCSKNFENANQVYNRNTFFIYAAIGFLLIVSGLFINVLLIQIITLPAGAFLVIESAVKNFDDKLYIIITFSLLIIAAVYLALKKLR